MKIWQTNQVNHTLDMLEPRFFRFVFGFLVILLASFVVLFVAKRLATTTSQPQPSQLMKTLPVATTSASKLRAKAGR